MKIIRFILKSHTSISLVCVLRYKESPFAAPCKKSPASFRGVNYTLLLSKCMYIYQYIYFSATILSSKWYFSMVSYQEKNIIIWNLLHMALVRLMQNKETERRVQVL